VSFSASADRLAPGHGVDEVANPLVRVSPEAHRADAERDDDEGEHRAE
jgi:hypothetical protein